MANNQDQVQAAELQQGVQVEQGAEAQQIINDNLPVAGQASVQNLSLTTYTLSSIINQVVAGAVNQAIGGVRTYYEGQFRVSKVGL